MEEYVGMRWHNLITRLARTSYPEAQVRLEDEAPRLAMVFRALGVIRAWGSKRRPSAP
jgi:nitric oxide reductase NorD protein